MNFRAGQYTFLLMVSCKMSSFGAVFHYSAKHAIDGSITKNAFFLTNTLFNLKFSAGEIRLQSDFRVSVYISAFDGSRNV